MRLRTTRSWTTAVGKRRYVRLYGSWRNLLARTRGSGRAGNGANYWKGKSVEWATFEEFREWAIAAGYSRARCSLDRIDVTDGYTSQNCRWATVSENTAYQRLCEAEGRAGDPVNYPDVPF